MTETSAKDFLKLLQNFGAAPPTEIQILVSKFSCVKLPSLMLTSANQR